MRRLIGAITAGATLFMGCGSSSSNETTPGLAGPAPSQSAGAPEVTGRIFLGAPVGPAQVLAKNTGGEVLVSTETTPGGYFNLGSGLPADFRVESTVGGVTLRTEVRGYQGQGREVVISIPTTLVSLASAGQSLPQAEAQVRTLLSIPEGTSLEYGIEESGRSAFSHFQYFLEASRAGGINSFNQQLLSSNSVHPFRLSLSSLRLPITGLAPQLQAIVDQARANPRLVKSALGKVASATPLVRAKEEEAPTLESLAQGIAGFVGNGVASSVLNSLTASAWTWLAQAMGLNYGTGTALAEVLDDLQTILNAIEELQAAGENTELKNALSDMNTYVANITTLNSKLTAAAGDFGWQYADRTDPSAVVVPLNLTNTVQDTPSTVSTLLAALASASTEQDIANLQDFLLGTASQTNAVALNLDLFRQSLGSDAQAVFANFPVRSNSLIDSGMTVYNRYSGYVNVGSNFLGEIVHGSSNLSKDIPNTYNTIANATFKNVEARHQAPALLPSESVFVDLENGLMWYTSIYDQDTYQNARQAASAKTVQVGNVNYSDWRLPSYEECHVLQERGRLVANSVKQNLEIPSYSQNGDGDYGETLWGLAALGFEVSSTTTWSAQFGDSAEIWYDHWDCKLPANKPNDINQPWVLDDDSYYYRLNRENDTTDHTTSKRAFILVRTIGTTPLLSPGFIYGQQNAGGNGGTSGGESVPIPTPPFPYEWTSSELQSAEYPGLGVVTGMDSPHVVNTTTPPVFAVNMTYRIQVGGPYKQTQGSGSFSSSPTMFVYNRTVGSDEVAKNASGGVPAFASSNNLLVSNSPDTAGQLMVQNITTSNSSVAGSANATFYSGLSLATLEFPVQLVPQSAGNGTVTVNTTYAAQFSQLPPRKLRSLQIMPRNQTYTTVANGGNVSYPYQFVNFYSDLTVENVSDSVSVNLMDASGTTTVNTAYWSYSNGTLTLDTTNLPKQVYILNAAVTVPSENKDTNTVANDTTQIRLK